MNFSRKLSIIAVLAFALLCLSPATRKAQDKKLLLGAGAPAAAGFSPADLSGLAVWFKADAITGLSDNDPVSTWNDSSGNSRNATQTGTLRPTYQTAEQNGLPIVRSDGSDDYLNTATFTTVAQPFTLFMVFKVTANTYILDSDSNNVNVISYVPSSNFLRFNAGLNVQYADALPIGYSAFTMLGNGASSLIRKDGVQKDAASGGTNGIGQLFIGASFLGTAASQTDFAEIILYSGDKTADFATVESYLKTKWGTP